MTNNNATPFVESLLSVIRQQRHLGIRTVIATQEPTVVPENMVGLCETVICHRFSSPLWWNYLHGMISLSGDRAELFEIIAGLRTGEGLVASSLALDAEKGGVGRIGANWMMIKVRRKITLSTGRSVLSQAV